MFIYTYISILIIKIQEYLGVVVRQTIAITVSKETVEIISEMLET